MALDTSLPTQVQAPSTLATVGNIASTANAIQQFQAGNIALQAQRQANVERQNLIKLFQEDPDAKALPDGTFNPALAKARSMVFLASASSSFITTPRPAACTCSPAPSIFFTRVGGRR